MSDEEIRKSPLNSSSTSLIKSDKTKRRSPAASGFAGELRKYENRVHSNTRHPQ